MINKKVKIINWLNAMISFIALILECMPKSMIKVKQLSSINYITSYHSYFVNPAEWDLSLMVAFIISILTIIGLIFNIIILIKNNKALYITSTVLSAILFFISTFLMLSRFATVYNVLILALFLIQTTIQIVAILYKDNLKVDKRITSINVANVFTLAFVLILEWIPNSIVIVQRFNYNQVSEIIGDGFSYFFYMSDNRLTDIAFIVALLTFCAYVFGFIALIKTKMWLGITSLTISSVCALSSIVILIMAGSSITPSNVIIMILFLALTILQGIKLKMSCVKSYKLNIEDAS